MNRYELTVNREKLKLWLERLREELTEHYEIHILMLLDNNPDTPILGESYFSEKRKEFFSYNPRDYLFYDEFIAAKLMSLSYQYVCLRDIKSGKMKGNWLERWDIANKTITELIVILSCEIENFRNPQRILLREKFRSNTEIDKLIQAIK